MGKRTTPVGVFIFMENHKVQCSKCSSIDYRIEQRGIHQTAFCNKCDAYIKNLPQGKPAQLHFGKYVGREISTMTSYEETEYLKWMVKKLDIKPNSLKEAIYAHLNLD